MVAADIFSQAERGRKEWLEGVIGGVGQALVVTNEKGLVTHINRKAVNLTGVSEGDAIGKHIWSTVIIKDSKTGKPATLSLAAIIESGDTLEANNGLRLETTAGEQAVQVIGNPLRRADGQIMGAVVMFCLPHQLGLDDDMLVKQAAPMPLNVLQEAIFIKKDGVYNRLNVKDIQVVEAMENYVIILTDRERYIVHATMKQMQEKLSRHGFIRVHRSYLVPLEGIESLDENRIRVCGDRLVPVGKSYRADLMNALTFL